MFRYNLLDDKRGIALMADHYTWTLLNQAIHDVVEPSSLLEGAAGEIFLAMAYEARKAADGYRETIQLPDANEGIIHVAEFNWVHILVWLRTFRASLPHTPHRKYHQALAYSLEGAVEDALDDEFGGEHQFMLDSWFSKLDGVKSLLERVDSLAEEFLTVGDAQKKAWLYKTLGVFSVCQ